MPVAKASPDIYLKDSPALGVNTDPGKIMDFVVSTQTDPANLTTSSGIEYYWYSPSYFGIIPGPKGHSFHLYYKATVATIINITVYVAVQPNGEGVPFLVSDKTYPLEPASSITHVKIPDVIIIPETELNGERIKLSLSTKDPITIYFDSIATPSVLNVVPPGVQTDWAFFNPSSSPPSPMAGDPVTFNVILSALSSTNPFPQSVEVIALLDGTPISGGTLSYQGPAGLTTIVSSTPPWIATEGTHTIIWVVDPSPYAYNDPNRANNQVTQTFTVGPRPLPFDFELTASPDSLTIKAGDTASFTVTAGLQAGTPSDVILSISDLPGGATSAFNPNKGKPTFSSNLIINTSPDIAQGTHILNIKGVGGGLTKTTAVKLTIKSPIEPDFEISAEPESQTIIPPQQTSYIITITGKGDFKSDVSLTVSGFPGGVQTSFEPSKGKPDFTSTLHVRATQEIPPKTYALTIFASGGGKTKSTVVNLIFREATKPEPTTTTAPITTPSPSLEIFTEYAFVIVIIILMIVIVALGTALILRGRR